MDTEKSLDMMQKSIMSSYKLILDLNKRLCKEELSEYICRSNNEKKFELIKEKTKGLIVEIEKIKIRLDFNQKHLSDNQNQLMDNQKIISRYQELLFNIDNRVDRMDNKFKRINHRLFQLENPNDKFSETNSISTAD